MVPGRSKQVFKQWLNTRPKDWRDGIDVVAMGGFSGFKTASVEELPEAVEVMDLFHVVKLAGDAPSMRYVAAFSRRPPGFADERQTRCIGRVGLCTPVLICSRPSSRRGDRRSVRQRQFHRRRSHLGRLSRHCERLPNQRRQQGQEALTISHRLRPLVWCICYPW
ncbi:Transposase [Corynebacterium diphtheriae]|nr:Transposase [Corynebacterium diphtheriae] [Corynebacterium diphtheriae subsp. lausannense]